MSKEEWNRNYAGVDDLMLDIDKQSPENFIDEIKMEYLRLKLPTGGVVVELGAGSGRLITRVGIERPGCKLVGVDYVHGSTMAINKNFQKYGLDGSAVCGDVFYIPLKDNSVDALMSGGLVEHFNVKEINIIIPEMMRILKPDGLFYADIAPKKFSMLRPIILKEAGGYENSFTRGQWERILYRYGLRNINIFSGLILPPNFYGIFKRGLGLRIMYMLKSGVTWMIGNKFSDVFGFEYFVFGRKK